MSPSAFGSSSKSSSIRFRRTDLRSAALRKNETYFLGLLNRDWPRCLGGVFLQDTRLVSNPML